MRLKHCFLLTISAAMFCTVSASAASSGIEAWYQARQQQLSLPQHNINQLRSQAESGDTDAQYRLALSYQSGSGVPQDLNQAKQWLESANRAGNVDAQYALALLLRELGGQANIQRSIKLQESASVSGHPEAQYGLGMLYANGQYVARDLYQAKHWLEQAQQRGNEMARFAISELSAPARPAAQPRPVNIARAPVPARPKVQPRQAAIPTAPIPARAQPQQLRPRPAAPAMAQAPRPLPAMPEPKLSALPAGNAGSRGPAHSSGAQSRNVYKQQAAPDLSNLSADQILAAARQGDMYAQLMVGAFYEDGSGGVEKSHESALTWYLRAARQGYPKAQHNLALLYEDGRGTKQDYRQAAIWYKKAAKAGFSESQNNLAVLYILGRGVQKDRVHAEQLLRTAVAAGNTNAKRNLSMLMNGAG